MLLALGAGTAAASPASQSGVTSTCWKDVINDWLAHEPNVVGTYPIACYTQAIQHLDSYSDIQGYSNAPEDIRRALLAALHNQGTGQSGGTPTITTTSSGLPNSSGGGSGPSAPNRNPVTRFFDSIGPGNAQSVPLPLLILAGLAILLLLAAAGTWLAKRIQARRVNPAPQPARTPAPPRD